MKPETKQKIKTTSKIVGGTIVTAVVESVIWFMIISLLRVLIEI